MNLKKIKPVFNYCNKSYPFLFVDSNGISVSDKETTLTIKDKFSDHFEKDGVYDLATCGIQPTLLEADLSLESHRVDYDQSQTISLKTLKYFYKFISNDETRLHLSSLCFQKEGVVATDGHRLTYKDSEIDNDETYLIPRNSVKVLISVMSKLKVKEVRILFNETHAIVDDLNFKLVSRLIQRDYPRWSNLIPVKFEETLHLKDIPSFAKLKPLFNKYQEGVVFEPIDENTVKMSIPDSLYKMTFEGSITKPFKVNYKYLNQAIDTGIKLKFTGKKGLGPIGYETPHFSGLIMPMKMD